MLCCTFVSAVWPRLRLPIGTTSLPPVQFGSGFLSKFEAAQCDNRLLEEVTLVDTPGGRVAGWAPAAQLWCRRGQGELRAFVGGVQCDKMAAGKHTARQLPIPA